MSLVVAACSADNTPSPDTGGAGTGNSSGGTGAAGSPASSGGGSSAAGSSASAGTSAAAGANSGAGMGGTAAAGGGASGGTSSGGGSGAADPLHGDVGTWSAFDLIFKDGAKDPSSTGFPALPWSGNCWDSAGWGEIAWKADVMGSPAISIRNLNNPPPLKSSIQFYTSATIPLDATKSYMISVDYHEDADAGGQMFARHDGTADAGQITVPLPKDATTSWKTATLMLPAGTATLDQLTFQNLTPGQDNALYVKNIVLTAN